MPAYVIAHVRVHDKSRYEEYMRLAATSVVSHGGRYIARGGAVETLDGGWRPQRLVLLEFPSMDAARRWWASEDYRRAMAIRHATATSEIVLLEGLDVPIA